MNSTRHNIKSMTILMGLEGEFSLCPTVMTEEELIRFLRIPEISNARSHRNVVENLKRTRVLPRIHLCGKTVYLVDAVKAWLEDLITCGEYPSTRLRASLVSHKIMRKIFYVIITKYRKRVLEGEVAKRARVTDKGDMSQ
jgi:hypothetical protein